MNTTHAVIVAGLLTTALLSSCSDDFLDREPLGSYTSVNYLQDELTVTQAITPGYASIRARFVADMYLLGELRSDNTVVTTNPFDQGDAGIWQTDLFVSGAAIPRSGNMWSDSYSAISRMNLVLEAIGDAQFVDEAMRTQREAETRFIRAFHYWLLVQHFGDVPLLLTPEFDAETLLSITRADVQRVYDEVIIPDATFAIANLPVSYSPSEEGRATKDAARMLLAKAHFTNRDYAAASPLLDSIIKGGRYSLLPDYRQVFAPSDVNNSEIIFAGEYSVAADQGATWMRRFLPLNSLDEVSGNPLINIGVSGAGLNRPTDDLLDAYFTDDPRLEQSVGLFISDGDSLYYPRKFIFPPLSQTGENQDWPIFRYADVLLMRAEALLETAGGGLPDEAFNLLNAIRGRAGVPLAFPFNSDPELDVRTAEEFRTLLRRERRVELAFENWRWYDLVRYGIQEERMREHGIAQRAEGGYIDAFPNAYQAIPALYPIPILQVAQFGYRQNPGY